MTREMWLTVHPCQDHNVLQSHLIKRGNKKLSNVWLESMKTIIFSVLEKQWKYQKFTFNLRDTFSNKSQCGENLCNWECFQVKFILWKHLVILKVKDGSCVLGLAEEKGRGSLKTGDFSYGPSKSECVGCYIVSMFTVPAHPLVPRIWSIMNE